MSYILKQVIDYTNDIKTYWYNEIDNSSYTNKDVLKSEIDTHCQELIDAYETYKSELDRKALSTLLIALFSYSIHKDVLQFDDPNIPPVDDLSLYIPTLYHNWNFELPEISLLFELKDDDTDPTKGVIKIMPETPPSLGSELNTPPIFDSLKNKIENEFAPFDNDYVPKQARSIASAYADNVMYRMFKNPPAKTKPGVDIKTVINTQYGLDEIKSEFNWSWPGLDD